MFTPDINELNLPKTCEINFPDDDDLLNFRLIISPDEVCGKMSIGHKTAINDFIAGFYVTQWVVISSSGDRLTFHPADECV